MLFRRLPLLAFAFLFLQPPASPQSATPSVAAASAPTAVPPLVPYSGMALTADGKPLAGERIVTFLIYKEESAGDPLWTESQTVTIDAAGHYKVQLGAASPNGLPGDLFASGEARWLEVQISGQTAQSRVLLASVPYALKAGDATTLGGLPASAFALAGVAASSGSASPSSVVSNVTSTVTTPGGTSGYIPIFSGASTVVDSSLFQNSTGVGIGTAAPAAALDVNGAVDVRGPFSLENAGTATATVGQSSQPLAFFASSYNSSTTAATAPEFQWKAEPAGNDTASPSGTLNFLYGNGAAPAETGLSIAANGVMKFAAGQTFPGTGIGTITGITATSPLTGGGTGGAVTLGLNTSALETTLNHTYAQLAAANAFTSSETFSGTAAFSNTATFGGSAVFNGSASFAKPVTFATGQSFPNTITAVTATSPLTGATSSGAVTVGLNIATLESTLNSVYAQLGAANTFNKSVTFTQPVTFPAGQIFPSTGTITGVTASSPLSGGGTTGSVTVSLDTSALETTLNINYAQLSAANTFTGNQAVNGNLSTTGTQTSQGAAAFDTSGMANTGLSGYGVVNGIYGQANGLGNGASGVSGAADAATGVVYGVSGRVASTSNGAAGVIGGANATSGQVFGVSGYTNSTTDYASGVEGNANATSGVVYGVSGGSNSTTSNAAGVSGYEGSSTGQVYGTFGSTNSTGNGAAGVSGFEGATTGQVYGVAGGTNSTGDGSAGVSGNANATTGNVFGVSGSSNSSTGGAGVIGISNATTTTGYTNGVFGSCASQTGCAGVGGFASASTGNGTGVSGSTASSTDGSNGVYGGATATTGGTFGVNGTSASPNGVGVQGASPGTAVAGFNQICSASGCTIKTGVAGKFVTATGGTVLQGLAGSSLSSLKQVFSVDSSGDGYFAGNVSAKNVQAVALNIAGDVNVTGKLTKGSGSFKIDHPLDPANKYLSHSFVESPDMMNVYNGNIVTDRHGRATVELPKYFQALNRDFRYQLTVIGQFAQAIVAREIERNRFTIRTNKPGVKVSWQVTGIRQDAYANADRIPVEEDKPQSEQGYYLHPEAFGQPASKGLVAAHRSERSANEVARLAGSANR